MSMTTTTIAAALALALAGCEASGPRLTERLVEIESALEAMAEAVDDPVADVPVADVPAAAAGAPMLPPRTGALDEPPAPRWASALDNLGFDESGQRAGASDAPTGGTTTIIVVPGSGSAPGAVGPTTVPNRPGTAIDPDVPPTPGTPRNAATPRFPTAGPTGAVGGPGTRIGAGAGPAPGTAPATGTPAP